MTVPWKSALSLAVPSLLKPNVNAHTSPIHQTKQYSESGCGFHFSLPSIIRWAVSGSWLHSRHLAPNVPLIVPLETWCTLCICAAITTAELYVLIITVPSLTTRQDTRCSVELLTEINAPLRIDGLVIKCKWKDHSQCKASCSFDCVYKGHTVNKLLKKSNLW